MCFKELAHMIVRPGKSKSCRVDQQDGHPGKSWNLSLKAVSWQFTHLPGKAVFFYSGLSWLDWVHHHYGGLSAYSVYPFEC